jgi:hypothetical protein
VRRELGLLPLPRGRPLRKGIAAVVES